MVHSSHQFQIGNCFGEDIFLDSVRVMPSFATAACLSWPLQLLLDARNNDRWE